MNSRKFCRQRFGAAGLAALTQRDYVRQVRALIETERPYLLAGLRALGLRVIFAYALHNTALFGYTAVWWSQAMAWTVTLLVCYAHVFRGKWKTKSLIS